MTMILKGNRWSEFLVKGNICIPDKFVIKQSPDNPLLTLLWFGQVVFTQAGTSPPTHSLMWSWSQVLPQTGWAGDLRCPFRPNHTEEKPKGWRLIFAKTADRIHTYCCSYTRTMPLKSKHNICSSQRACRCQKHVQKRNSIKAIE